jgi:hypothetical protein
MVKLTFVQRDYHNFSLFSNNYTEMYCIFKNSINIKQKNLFCQLGMNNFVFKLNPVRACKNRLFHNLGFIEEH